MIFYNHFKLNYKSKLLFLCNAIITHESGKSDVCEDCIIWHFHCFIMTFIRQAEMLTVTINCKMLHEIASQEVISSKQLPLRLFLPKTLNQWWIWNERDILPAPLFFGSVPMKQPFWEKPNEAQYGEARTCTCGLCHSRLMMTLSDWRFQGWKYQSQGHYNNLDIPYAAWGIVGE